ncbi:LacI family transcriptional regulator [Paenibacillus sp. J5C_2022]|uniref:LacI family DNA-binding transcriptional regulator n=1 Tax=Paenibacillus sp. J5C2022 TaxID=2977129 RepID=UPI0021CF5EA9|nr:LacI family DNA-binding transcriptional regulator [Paenibacillus sp. J5C2022]MCU6709956.1 LacI family transcriptional regulator [Paenibacillus sp. J5C2022]
MATLKDVAKLAGVAPITVSRVINDPQSVKERTRLKVEQAIKQINYMPNSIARSLVTNRTNTIGVLLSNIANPYFSDFILGVETKARELGKNVFICNGMNYESAMSNINLLMEKRVDGMILTSFEFDSIGLQEKLLRELERLNANEKHSVQFVLVDPSPKQTLLTSIQIDNYMAATVAMDHLHELGHKAIAHLSLNRDADVWIDRFKAYKDAQGRINIPLNTEHIALIDKEDVRLAEEATYRLLLTTPRPTAIFAANDTLAVGALQAAHRTRLRIPEDISIIGIDGNDIAKHSYPRMTTVVHPRYRLGELSAELLIDLINGKEDTASLLIKCTLQVNESTGPLLMQTEGINEQHD